MNDEQLARFLGGTTGRCTLPRADEAAAERAGWQAVTLSTPAGTDKPALMDGFARALALPAWFGRNWDALADSLRDVHPPAGRAGVLLVWRGSDSLDEGLRATALDVLDERTRLGADFKVALTGD